MATSNPKPDDEGESLTSTAIMENKLQLIVTKDGSHSIFNSELNETYHSVGGAIQESEFIYIDKGLKSLPFLEKIDLLEIGFGTGLNAILSLREAYNQKIQIDYTTLEPFPIPEELIDELNYTLILKDSFLTEKFKQLHSSPWERSIELVPEFTFAKLQIRLEQLESNKTFDLVYYDAFAPSKQSDIWDIENLRKIRGLLKKGGCLITYCSNGKFKRDLKEVGFRIETLPGPLGKREITRAWAE